MTYRRSLVVASALMLAAAAGCVAPGAGGAPAPRTPASPTAPEASGSDATLPPRPADAAADIAYYQERTAALASGALTDIARTDFARLRRGALYLLGPSDSAAQAAAHAQLMAAFRASDANAMLAASTTILASDQADIRAHALAALALRRADRTAEADFHHQMAMALVESILQTGDGRGFKSAWTVFRTKEEYEVLMARGYIVRSQSLKSDGGRDFDVLSARDAQQGQSIDAFFDITELFAEEGRAMSAR
jgi:hypothetical protein